MKNKKQAFSIIEIIIAIFIFSLGLASIFMLINSSLNANLYNKNQLVASNLARENIELFRNIRDSNYKQEKPWNIKNPSGENYNDKFDTLSYYKLENDFSNGTIKVEKISDFGEGISEIKDAGKMQNYRLCLDLENHYTYNCTTNPKTNFYKYLEIEEVSYSSGGTIVIIPDAYKIISKVYWYDRGLHDVEIKTIVSDFIRL